MVNAVGDGRAFEVPDNAGWLLGADGSEVELPSGSKGLLASRVWDAVAARLRYRLNRPASAEQTGHVLAADARRAPGAPTHCRSRPARASRRRAEPRSPAVSSLAGPLARRRCSRTSLAEELLSDESAAAVTVVRYRRRVSPPRRGLASALIEVTRRPAAEVLEVRPALASPARS